MTQPLKVYRQELKTALKAIKTSKLKICLLEFAAGQLTIHVSDDYTLLSISLPISDSASGLKIVNIQDLKAIAELTDELYVDLALIESIAEPYDKVLQQLHCQYSGHSITFNNNQVKMLEKVAKSASQDGTKKCLTAVNIKQAGDLLKLAATDGHRLSEHQSNNPAQSDFEYNVLAKQLLSLSKLGFVTPSVIFDADLNVAVIQEGRIRLVIPLIDELYPHYDLLIPTEFKTVVELTNSSKILPTVKLAVKDRKSAVTLTTRMGDEPTKYTLCLNGNGIEQLLDLRPKYLCEALDIFGKGAFSIKIVDRRSPVVFQNDDQSMLHLLMPLYTFGGNR